MAGPITGNEMLNEYGRGTDLLKIPAGATEYTASRIAGPEDVGKIAYINSASANSFTIPPDGGAPFLTGSLVTVCQWGAGATTIVAGSGVTIRCAATLVLVGQYAIASVVKRGPNEWLAFGNLT